MIGPPERYLREWGSFRQFLVDDPKALGLVPLEYSPLELGWWAAMPGWRATVLRAYYRLEQGYLGLSFRALRWLIKHGIVRIPPERRGTRLAPNVWLIWPHVIADQWKCLRANRIF